MQPLNDLKGPVIVTGASGGIGEQLARQHAGGAGKDCPVADVVSPTRPSATSDPQMRRPPDDLPVYRLLTGPDDADFCRRVSDALALGYELWGSPALSRDEERGLVSAQAVVWPSRTAAGTKP